MDGCFPTALGRQSNFNNILGLPVSHSDMELLYNWNTLKVKQLSWNLFCDEQDANAGQKE